MTDLKGLPVAGYQAQPTVAVEEVNTNKRIEERCLRRIEALLASQELNLDGRWAAIAKTHIEEAFMALNRAIFKPGRVTLSEDANLPNPYTPPLPAALRAQRDAHIMPEPQPDLTDKDETGLEKAVAQHAVDVLGEPEKSA